MVKNWEYSEYLNAYLGVLAAVMIMFPAFIAIALAGYVIFVVVGMRRKLLIWKQTILGWAFILLYVAYLIAALFTHYPQQAMATLEYKLSLLILPLLLAFRLRDRSFQLAPVATGLIVGVTAATFFGLVKATLCYADEGSELCFLTGSVSPLHHPSYFMAYHITALYLAWYGYFRKWQGYRLFWILPFTLLVLVMHVLSLSLAGFLFLLLMIFAAFLYVVYRRFGLWSSLSTFVLLPVLGYFAVTNVPQISGDWEGAKTYANLYIEDPEAFVKNIQNPASGSEQRLILWTVSWQELKHHPLGIGTGNVDEILGNALREKGQHALAEKNLNPHNQFLQTGLEIGWMGLAIFLFILGYTFRQAFKYRDGLLFVLVSCLAFNCLFESMLQRQSGIVFFTFWILLAFQFLTDRRKLN